MGKQKSRPDSSERLCCSGAVSAPEKSATVVNRRHNLFLLGAFVFQRGLCRREARHRDPEGRQLTQVRPRLPA
jgi:hypothetical protein